MSNNLHRHQEEKQEYFPSVVKEEETDGVGGEEGAYNTDNMSNKPERQEPGAFVMSKTIKIQCFK